jgi:RNA polymerase sigma-70 factor (ECF subfamily)
MSFSLPCTWSALPFNGKRDRLPVERLTTEDLIVRCQKHQKDRTAFTELVRRHSSHVERLIAHLAPEWEDRADLLQEVWIRVFRNLPKLQEPQKFRTWLSRIVTNLFYDELRKRKRRQPALSLDAPYCVDGDALDWELADDQPSPDEQLSTREFYQELHSAIARLPESFRTTIVLREIEGLAYEEIAELTGVSLGTVKSRIARARQRLQTDLMPYVSEVTP